MHIFFLLCCALFLIGCSGDRLLFSSRPKVEVSMVSTVETYATRATNGYLSAPSTPITADYPGTITKQHYTPGQFVRQGQALFSLMHPEYGERTVNAPDAGRVGESLYRIGETVTESDLTLTNLELAEPMTAVFNIEPHIVQLGYAEGILPEKAMFEIRVDEALNYAAQVPSHQAQRAGSTDQSITFNVPFPNPQGTLISGTNVEVIVRSTEKRPFKAVPESALHHTPHYSYLLTVDDKQRIVKKRVTLVAQYDSLLLITGRIDAGEYVVTTSHPDVGSKVRRVTH